MARRRAPRRNRRRAQTRRRRRIAASSPWTTTNHIRRPLAAPRANTSDVLVAGLVDEAARRRGSLPRASRRGARRSRPSPRGPGRVVRVEVEETNSQKENAAPRNTTGPRRGKSLGADDDALELMDEDALLDEDEIRAGANAAARARADGGDCSAKATACRIARAGTPRWRRREELAERKRRSRACGNCYLAFRCAGCPMLRQRRRAAGSEQGHRRHGGRHMRGDFLKYGARRDEEAVASAPYIHK